MKDFLKYTLATITGIIATSIIGFILLFVLTIAIVASSSSDSEVKINNESILVLKLSGTLTERSGSEASLLGYLKDENNLSLDAILNAIKKAKSHDNISGIYLDMGSLNAGMSSLNEIRDALVDFQKSGKYIVSYADQYTQGAYYLASVADNLYVNPQGSIHWAGLASNPVFYTNLLKKIGVEMQIFKVGTYKSAVEPYTQEQMSAASKEQVQVFLNDIWTEIVTSVSKSRSIPEVQLNTLADQMLTFKTGDFYVKQNLADSVVYRNDINKVLENISGNEKIKKVTLKQMKSVKEDIHKEAKTIAIYYAEGAIVDSAPAYNNDGLINASQVIKDLKKLEKDDKIKGVVIRVNSPGGSAYGSEQIWKAIKDLKAKKPVAVSMGDYAASGGYYISSASDCIVAEPTTLTGSIGIFAMIPNTAKLTESIGITFDTVKTNKHADFGSLGRAFTPEEKDILQSYVNGGYELFIKRCADGRHMSTEDIKKIAEGRVWTGKRAQELGLVDMLGGIDEAIRLVVNDANIEHYRLKKYPAETDFFTKLINSSLSDVIETRLLSKDVKNIIDETRRLEALSKESILQARLPYTLNIQ